MNFFRTKLFILFMIIVAGTTFYYFGDTQKLFNSSLQILDKTPLKNIAQQAQNINKEKINVNLDSAIQNAEEEMSQLSTRTQEIKEHASNILGTSKILESPIEATQDSTPIHEKALEYGQYIYCKSVVEDYERFNIL
ncbi:hypothetical protein KKD03_03105 [Patescibacteria group bacterium]|nr:hypothetical protein [Patescibacteria group bacterium]